MKFENTYAEMVLVVRSPYLSKNTPMGRPVSPKLTMPTVKDTESCTFCLVHLFPWLDVFQTSWELCSRDELGSTGMGSEHKFEYNRSSYK